MIDKLFYTFTFLLCISITMSWFFTRKQTTDGTILTIAGVSIFSAVITFAGFVITGILRIWL